MGPVGPPSDRAPEPLRRFRGPALSGPVARVPRRARGPVCGSPSQTGPRGYPASACFAAASIAASDFRTWLRSVVYQKSGSDALR
ncbi:hypothetical protein GCM10010383_67120 [Streptomyces lomondensis]|uniref:Uncharacterized protein n=1 Tax=Streptomyces lomondensis TaxID=68229 RepID=A0ABQ2XNY6_9ACTN|nr:hypothetical protein GCM10010383_67120 [Streptomyces lomondensis]